MPRAANPTARALLALEAIQNTPGITYAQAGVDIDAGNEMVNRIKPLVRATRRPGARV